MLLFRRLQILTNLEKNTCTAERRLSIRDNTVYSTYPTYLFSQTMESSQTDEYESADSNLLQNLPVRQWLKPEYRVKK